MSEATIFQQALALPACDGSAVVEAGANTKLDGNRVSWRNGDERHGQADRETENNYR